MLEIVLGNCTAVVRDDCVLCGETWEPHWGRTPLARVDGEGQGFVCDDCVRAGVEGIRERMKALAATFRGYADALLGLAAGPIKAITPEEVEAAIFQSELEYATAGFDLDQEPPDWIENG